MNKKKNQLKDCVINVKLFYLIKTMLYNISFKNEINQKIQS